MSAWLRGALGFALGVVLAQRGDEDLDVLLGVVAGGRGDRLEAADVAVVVRAQHVNGQRVAAVELVGHVGDIAGDIGRIAV